MKNKESVKEAIWIVVTMLTMVVTTLLSQEGLAERTYTTPASFTLARGWVISVDLQDNTEVNVTADADGYFMLRLGQETKWSEPLPTLREEQQFHIEETLPVSLGQVQDWKVVGSESGTIFFQIKGKESPAKVRVYPTSGEEANNRLFSGFIAFWFWLLMSCVMVLL